MNFVLTNWRGVFTSEHPTLVTVPRAYDSQYKNLALMALLQAPYIHIQNIPDTKRSAWRTLAQIAPTQHCPYAAALLQHPTQARNILLMSGDAREVLHHCLLASNIRR